MQSVIRVSSTSFDSVLICMSFVTRSHLRTLKKGFEEGPALQVLRTILARTREFFDRNIDRVTQLMKKYLENCEEVLPKFVSSHFVFNGFANLAREPRFRGEGWMDDLRKFLRSKTEQLSNVKSLLCITATLAASKLSKVKLDKLPKEFQLLLHLH